MRDRVKRLEKRVGGDDVRAFPIYIGYGDREEFTVRYRSWPPAGRYDQVTIVHEETFPMEMLHQVVEQTKFVPGAPKVLGFEVVDGDGHEATGGLSEHEE